MPKYVFQYSQALDIRWYASQPVNSHSTKAAAVSAMTAKNRITFENGRWVEWALTSSSFGVCYALSTYWIICKAKGDDFLAWLRPGSRACPQVADGSSPGAGPVVADIKAMQISQRGKDPTIKLCDAMDRVKQATGLVTRDSVMVKSGPLKEKSGLCLVIIKGERQAAPALSDMSGEDGFNHAIAVSVNAKDHVLLFDPNRGEIELSCVDEANQFIDYLCKNSSQYHLRSYTLEWSAAASQRIKKGNF